MVTATGNEEEAISRLARVGYDNTIGFLENGYGSWKNSGRPVFKIPSIPSQQLSAHFVRNQIKLIDVRRDAEHVFGSMNLPLDSLENNIGKLDKTEKYYVHCKSGYRSMIASSILMKNGFSNVIDVKGGFLAISMEKIPLSQYRCPTTIS